jgi:magnesium transporter
MVSFFYKAFNKIAQSSDLKLLNNLGYDDILWIDLNDPYGKEKRAIEAYLNTDLQTRAMAEEIESSSRYLETEHIIYANTNFLISQGDGYENEPLSCILTEGILVTVRNTDLRTLNDIGHKLLTSHRLYPTGYHLLVAILESRIDLDADMIEGIAKEIGQLSKQVSLGEKVDKEMLYYLNQLQENIMAIRENIIDKQRVLSSILKSDQFPTDVYAKVNVMIKDVNSLINHTNFGFERLDYLQETIMGLINIEQSKIIKIFTIVSVIFMPPTLIASIYGMNFTVMPEINWKYGYLFSIGLMILSVAFILVYFKKKKFF